MIPRIHSPSSMGFGRWLRSWSHLPRLVWGHQTWQSEIPRIRLFALCFDMQNDTNWRNPWDIIDFPWQWSPNCKGYSSRWQYETWWMAETWDTNPEIWDADLIVVTRSGDFEDMLPECLQAQVEEKLNLSQDIEAVSRGMGSESHPNCNDVFG